MNLAAAVVVRFIEHTAYPYWSWALGSSFWMAGDAGIEVFAEKDDPRPYQMLRRAVDEEWEPREWQSALEAYAVEIAAAQDARGEVYRHGRRDDRE